MFQRTSELITNNLDISFITPIRRKEEAAAEYLIYYRYMIIRYYRTNWNWLQEKKAAVKWYMHQHLVFPGSYLLYVHHLYSECYQYSIKFDKEPWQSWCVAREYRSCFCSLRCCSWKMGKTPWCSCSSSS